MVVFGLLLIALGVLAIVAALFVSKGEGELLGLALSVPEIFIAGVLAGAFILWGVGVLKYGTKRGIRQRQERRKLTELSKQLEQVEADRAPNSDES